MDDEFALHARVPRPAKLGAGDFIFPRADRGEPDGSLPAGDDILLAGRVAIKLHIDSEYQPGNVATTVASVASREPSGLRAVP